MFELHPQLKKDLLFIKDKELSSFFLLPNSENPWLVLVPKLNNITEWFQLNPQQQNILCQEITLASTVLNNEFNCDKINIGALGNMVPQLHIHIIARYKSDKAWPGALWGHSLNKNQTTTNSWLEKIASQL